MKTLIKILPENAIYEKIESRKWEISHPERRLAAGMGWRWQGLGGDRESASDYEVEPFASGDGFAAAGFTVMALVIVNLGFRVIS